MISAPVNRVKLPESPCHHCEERTARCHAECERYKNFRRRVYEQHQKMKQVYEREQVAQEVLMRGANKAKKKRN